MVKKGVTYYEKGCEDDFDGMPPSILVCEKCNKPFLNYELVSCYKLNTSHPYPNPPGHTPIMSFDGVVSPCCHATFYSVSVKELEEILEEEQEYHKSPINEVNNAHCSIIHEYNTCFVLSITVGIILTILWLIMG